MGSSDTGRADEAIDLAQAIARALTESGLTCAVAESITGGNVVARLAAGQGASSWLKGGVVAYSSAAKYDVLDVTPGPVVTAQCAQQMAVGVSRLLAGDVAVATTGAGGPGPEEGQPAGTVFIAVKVPSGEIVRKYEFSGDPAQIVEAATLQTLRDLRQAADELHSPHSQNKVHPEPAG
jgi:nicotinamide-nucleotide amidase